MAQRIERMRRMLSTLRRMEKPRKRPVSRSGQSIWRAGDEVQRHLRASYGTLIVNQARIERLGVTLCNLSVTLPDEGYV